MMMLFFLALLPSPRAILVKSISPSRSLKHTNHEQSSNVAPPGGNIAWPLRPAGSEVMYLDSAPDRFYVSMPQGIAVSVFCWGSALLAIWTCPRLSWEFKLETADRLLASAHAIAATTFGLIAELGTFAVCQVGRSWMITAIQLTVGYMIVDLLSMLILDVWKKWRKCDVLMFAHHGYIILFFTLGGYFDMGVWFLVIGMINEASTPLLSALFILKHHHPQSRWLMPTGVAFAVMFFLSRIVFIPISYYQFAGLGFCDGFTTAQTTLSASVKPCYAFIYALNCYWFYKTIQGAIKATKGKADAVLKEG